MLFLVFNAFLKTVLCVGVIVGRALAVVAATIVAALACLSVLVALVAATVVAAGTLLIAAFLLPGVVARTVTSLLTLAVLALTGLIALFALLVVMRAIALRPLAVLRLTLLVAALAGLVALLPVGVVARTVRTLLLALLLQPGAKALGTEAALVFVVTPVGHIVALNAYARAHRPVSTLIVKVFCLLVAVTAAFGLTGRQTVVLVFQFF